VVTVNRRPRPWPPPRPPPPARRPGGGEYDWNEHLWPTWSTPRSASGAGPGRRLQGRERRADGFFRTWIERLRRGHRGQPRRLAQRRHGRIPPVQVGFVANKSFFVPRSATTAGHAVHAGLSGGRLLPHPRTAQCWWTATAASAAATASRPARTEAGSSTRPPTPPRSAPGATTASPRG